MSASCCNIPQINCSDNQDAINKAVQDVIKDRPKLAWLLKTKLISVTFAGTAWLDEDGNLISKEYSGNIKGLFKYKIEYRAYTESNLFAVFN